MFQFPCAGVKFDTGDIKVSLVTHVNSASLTALDRQLCYQFIQWIVSVVWVRNKNQVSLIAVIKYCALANWQVAWGKQLNSRVSPVHILLFDFLHNWLPLGQTARRKAFQDGVCWTTLCPLSEHSDYWMSETSNSIQKEPVNCWLDDLIVGHKMSLLTKGNVRPCVTWQQISGFTSNGLAYHPVQGKWWYSQSAIMEKWLCLIYWLLYVQS